MGWNISRVFAICTFLHSCRFSLDPVCIFIDGLISLTCTQGNQEDNLESSSVPVFISAAAWGVGVRVQCRWARAQLGVCIHDLCGLYTERGDSDDLLCSQSQSSFLTCWNALDYLQAWKYYRKKNVTLEHTALVVECVAFKNAAFLFYSLAFLACTWKQLRIEKRSAFFIFRNVHFSATCCWPTQQEFSSQPVHD